MRCTGREERGLRMWSTSHVERGLMRSRCHVEKERRFHAEKEPPMMLRTVRVEIVSLDNAERQPMMWNRDRAGEFGDGGRGRGPHLGGRGALAGGVWPPLVSWVPPGLVVPRHRPWPNPSEAKQKSKKKMFSIIPTFKNIFSK